MRHITAGNDVMKKHVYAGTDIFGKCINREHG
jgi:hypothetical protein